MRAPGLVPNVLFSTVEIWFVPLSEPHGNSVNHVAMQCCRSLLKTKNLSWHTGLRVRFGSRNHSPTCRPKYGSTPASHQVRDKESMAVDGGDGALNPVTAFGVNGVAALMILVGGMVVLSSKLLRTANPLVLALALGTSGGVTLFIALVPLFSNSMSEFTDAFTPEDDSGSDDSDDIAGNAWLATTGSFGGGILISYLIDFIVQQLTPGQNANGTARTREMTRDSFDSSSGKMDIRPPVEFIEDPGLDVFIRMDEAAKQKLQAMGVLSAIAVGIHNVPEGIATFVASSEQLYVGVSLAIGVGLHNIAEGVAVAAPIYFATGSRCKALMWCFWSAVAQALGGVIAYLCMGMDADDLTQAILYGLSSGMMVGIAVKELIPTAYLYANGRMHLVSAGALFGAFFMAACLIFFKFVGV
ncbi:Zinc transporter [Phytophthora pseudosyringae]|uniref:Zinc transporter n=1 Tax=Phytophthora pseudosyringae TaxID=221518 RepID=A0A8T1VG68_9STRA|nr:Zinc transporter [Phytophthora pseudosyringae]